jgi:hypothetical protein
MMAKIGLGSPKGVQGKGRLSLTLSLSIFSKTMKVSRLGVRAKP